jgi:hypothetical protein
MESTAFICGNPHSNWLLDRLLLKNVDAKRVVITSDHGNGIYEWGIYEYPIHMSFSCIREIPWITTTAEDRGTHTPDDHEITSNTSAEEKLKTLRYVE